MVEEFRYLGIMVNERGREVDGHSQAGNSAYFVYVEFWRTTIRYETEMRIEIRSVVTDKDVETLNRLRNKIIRGVCGIRKG